MSTHVPGFQSFSGFFVSFCIGQTSHQQHKGYDKTCTHGLLRKDLPVAVSVVKYDGELGQLTKLPQADTSFNFTEYFTNIFCVVLCSIVDFVSLNLTLYE